MRYRTSHSVSLRPFVRRRSLYRSGTTAGGKWYPLSGALWDDGRKPDFDNKERLRVVEIALEEAKGKVPVLAGAGGYNTSEVVELARELEAMEVDGLLSVTPYYNKPTPEGLYEHYKAIAAATRLPIVLYNVPSRTGTNITPSTLARLASIDNIVGVKEASGDIGQMAAIFQQVPKTFSVLSGDDSVTVPLMALGWCRSDFRRLERNPRRDVGPLRRLLEG